MAANVEIKARLHDPAETRARAAALSDTPVAVLIQTDTFFRTPAGRFKLREQEGIGAELIYYERADAQGPKESQYELYPVATASAAQLRRALTTALGVRGVVRKRRELYRVGGTRIHIDEVEGLGAFLELEVRVSESESAAEGHEIARQLMDQLGVSDQDLVSGAYLDLLVQR